MNFSTIGEKLKYLRVKADLTQEAVGKKIKVSKQTLYKYENGIITNIPSDKIVMLAEIYNVTPAYIMGWDNPTIKESSDFLPSLTPKDEREIARDLEKMLNSLDNKSGMAAYNNPEDEEDRELLKASLLTSMRLAKQMAKKKFTPKKYRKE